jgi:F-type H+-transporting ATPase subunit epsilon
MMNLKVLLPNRVLLDREVGKISGEAENGSFTILPRHVDFVTVLVPGLLMLTDREDNETFLAVDEGVLVKKEKDVLVSVRRAIQSDSLEDLHTAVEQEFRRHDEQERQARSALVDLETDLLHHFMALGEQE